MEKSALSRQIKDAFDLLRMLEHLSDGLRNSPPAETPWAGIRLTLSQARELLGSALEQLQQGSAASREAFEQETRPAFAESAPLEPEPRPRLRELVDESQYVGTFNRVQLSDARNTP